MERKTIHKIRKFTDLKVWQKGHRLVILVYEITKEFPNEEKFSLVSQMRRAASSVTSNVAEGFGRRTYKEKIHFYYQAQGSLIELKNQMFIARDVEYIFRDTFSQLMGNADNVHRLLQGLIKSSKSFLEKR